MAFTLVQLVGLATVGMIAGLIGGLLGVGGSIIMIPGMVILLPNREQHLFQASAMIVNVFVAMPAAVRHWAAGAVLKPIIRWLIPGALAGVILGVALSNVAFFKGANADRLGKVFALFLAYVTFYNIYRLVRGNRMPTMNDEQSGALPPARVFTVGGVMGLAAGLTGIGGGALAVPLQQVFLRIPLKNAIANSACTIAFSALIGSVYKNVTLPMDHGIAVMDSVVIALVLIPTAFIGSWLGANLTHRLPRTPVRIVFILFLISGVWTTWSRPNWSWLAKRAEPPTKAVVPATQPSATQPG